MGAAVTPQLDCPPEGNKTLLPPNMESSGAEVLPTASTPYLVSEAAKKPATHKLKAADVP